MKMVFHVPISQIQKYYKMKDEYPEIFKVSPPSEMKFMLEMQCQCMLPKKDDSGRQIYLFRVGKLFISPMHWRSVI